MNKAQTPVCLITGAGRRVGAQTAKTLHAGGFNLILHYNHSHKDTEDLIAQLNQTRDNSACSIKGDLRNLKEIQAVADFASQQWQRLDVLINNASVFYPTDIAECKEEQWNEIMEVNLKAPLFLAQALAPALKEHKGCIVNMIDIHGDRPLKQHPIYCVSKAGLAMLTRSLARELAPDIRCNGVAPGAVLWPENSNQQQREDIISRTALKREGSPEDIAKAILFLIKDADYITGQIITVDGGRTLSN